MCVCVCVCVVCVVCVCVSVSLCVCVCVHVLCVFVYFLLDLWLSTSPCCFPPKRVACLHTASCMIGVFFADCLMPCFSFQWSAALHRLLFAVQDEAARAALLSLLAVLLHCQ